MLRYLGTLFDAEAGRAYRPFLKEEWEQMPYQDMFFANFGRSASEITETDLRMAESTAHQVGKKQIVAEISGTFEKENNSRQKKRPFGFYYANGVNRICLTEPLEEEKQQYYMRLGYFLGEGKIMPGLALFEPDEEDCRLFSKYGIPFHILKNTGMTKYGTEKEGRIICGRCTYEYLVLPSGAVLGGIAKECICSFAENGGKLLLLGEPAVSGEQPEQSLLPLKSSCTFGEIAREQIYRCKNPETEIYSTYRKLNEMEVLYAVNASQTRSYTQTFDLGGKVHSFLRLNLMDFTTKQIPLSFRMRPGEEVLLIPYGKTAGM